MLKASKLSQRSRPWIQSQKNLEDEIFWKFWSKLGKFRQKMPFFTKMRFIQNHILRYNLSYSEATVLKFGKCMQKKSTKNSQEAEFWIFDFFQFYWIFSDFFKEKQTKVALKRKKIKNSKLRFLLTFCTFFLHIHLPNFRTLASL